MSVHTRWKRQESRVARLLGAQRLPNDGLPHADVENEVLAAEVKDRVELPQWIVAAVNKARDYAGSKRLGLLVLTSGTERQALVVLDIRDYQKWYVGRKQKEEV